MNDCQKEPTARRHFCEILLFDFVPTFLKILRVMMDMDFAVMM